MYGILKKISVALGAISFHVLFAANAFAKTAADFDYPVQEFRVGVSNTDRSVTASEAKAGGYLKSETFIGNGSQKWFLNYVSDGVFEIVNSQTGLLVTDDKGLAVLSESFADDDRGKNQKWIFCGIEKDFDGYDLYYKIASLADTNQVLTFNVNSNSLDVAPFVKGDFQKFKVNLNGLEGFAANAKVDEGEKAGVIGGLFGRTVVVSTVADFKKAIGSVEPLTVVISGNLDMQKEAHTRIRDNKTIVGSYKAKTLQDCFLRTNNEYGNEGDEPSDNIVLRNVDFEAVNVEDRILVNIWSSRNIWFDHCTFNSKLNRAEDEVGKFIWINTPYMDYLDKKDNGRSPDYITISYCTFTNRFWTVAYGTQNSETRRDRTTLMYNTWDRDVRRCPQLGNGIAHIYNNLYIGSDSGNDKSTNQIISGEGSEMVSEFCRFQSVTGKEIVGDKDPYRDNGSMTSKTSTATPTLLNYTPKKTSNWNPSKTNYGYTLLQAYNTKGTDTKDFNMAYAGAFDAYSKIKYIGDEELKKFVNTVYPSPFLKSIEVGNDVVRKWKTGARMDDVKYTIKNANSNLYLGVEKDSSIQQNENAEVWVLTDAEDGFYYITRASAETSAISLEEESDEKGIYLQLKNAARENSQKFKFVKNEDGTYNITTYASRDAGCVGIVAGSKETGASAVQWPCDSSSNQNWFVNVAEDSGTLRLKNVELKTRSVLLNNHQILYEAPAGSTVQVFSVNGHLLYQEISSGYGNIYLKQNQRVILKWR